MKEEKKTEGGRRQYFIKASNRINIPKELQEIIKTPAIYVLNFFPSTGELVLTPYGQKNEK